MFNFGNSCRGLQILEEYVNMLTVIVAKIKMKTKFKNWFRVNKGFLSRTSYFIVSLILVALLSTSGINYVKAQSLQGQIDDLIQKNTENKTNVEKLQEIAVNYNDAINKLEHDIEETQRSLDVSRQRQADLQQQIVQTEKDLSNQKELLAKNIRTMYLEGDFSTLEMLSTSKDLSEYINKQQYRDSVKDKILSTLARVENLKNQLKTQEEQVEAEIKEQSNSRTTLAVSKNEQNRLLAMNQAQQEEYNASTKANQDKIKQLQEAQRALEASLAKGKFVSLGSIKQGEIVGYVGNTGFSTGPHLHFEARNSEGVDVNPSNYVGSSWIRPVEGGFISQNYGNPDSVYYKGYHTGTDYAGVTGRPVRAVADGEIVWRGCKSSCSLNYGYYVLIRHSDGMFSLYGHMSN